MKSKKAVYVLLIVVLGIWGSVIYKLFFQKKGEEPLMQTESNFHSEALNLAFLNDTFSIHHNYRDPFLGKAQETRENTDAKPHVVVPKPAPVPVVGVKWPAIVFNGLIRNQKSNKQVALMQIDGQHFNMMPGNTEKGIELRHLYKDSVELFFNKERKVIKK